MRKSVSCFAAVAVLCLTVPLRADHHIETVLDGLDNPSGVTIQPETGHVFVSDSGAGRVIRVVDGKAQDVITGFPIDVYGKGPKYNIGPLGLAFLDEDTLVVGGGGQKDGDEQLRVYKIPKAGEKAIAADKMEAQFKLAPSDETKGEGNFYGLAVTKGGIYVTCNGDDTKGWVAKATRDGTKVGPFKRFLATKEETDIDAPVAITVSPRGELVVGQMGEVTVPNDGLLTFYGEDGKMLANFETGLSDVTDIAYSPKGMLYALDFSWVDATKGGLFRLVAKRDGNAQTVIAKEMEKLDKPSAMVFGKDGSLYITVFGTADGDKKGGKLLKVEIGL